jgi:hypothetical protein
MCHERQVRTHSTYDKRDVPIPNQSAAKLDQREMCLGSGQLINNTAITLASTSNDNNSNSAIIATAHSNWNDLYPITVLTIIHLHFLSVKAARNGCTHRTYS